MRKLSRLITQLSIGVAAGTAITVFLDQCDCTIGRMTIAALITGVHRRKSTTNGIADGVLKIKYF